MSGLSNVVLVGNYHLIPLTNTYEQSYLASALQPYDQLTKEIRKALPNKTIANY